MSADMTSTEGATPSIRDFIINHSDVEDLNLGVRERFAQALLRDVHLPKVHFGQHSVTMTDKINVGSTVAASVAGDIGRDSSGLITVYDGSSEVIVADRAWVTTGITRGKPAATKDYLGTRTVAQINALSPVAGQTVIAGDADTPAAGSSDLLAVGDVVEFDGTQWKIIVTNSGGFVPDGTVLLIHDETITLYSPLTDGSDEGKVATFDGTSNTPSLAPPIDGQTHLIHGNNSINENTSYTYDTGLVLWVLTSLGTSSHLALAGLTTGDAGHTQFALLAGRAGGQILVGGTASGEDLTFRTTSHATKGDYIFDQGDMKLSGMAAATVTTAMTLDYGSTTYTGTPNGFKIDASLADMSGMSGGISLFSIAGAIGDNGAAGTNGLYIDGKVDRAILIGTQDDSGGVGTERNGTVAWLDNSFGFVSSINWVEASGDMTWGTDFDIDGAETRKYIWVQNDHANASSDARLELAAIANGGTAVVEVAADQFEVVIDGSQDPAVHIRDGVNDWLLIDSLNDHVDLGNATDNPAFNFLGTGVTTFNGNVDAVAGLDVSGAALTVTNQAITQTTGGQVTFAGNVDANGGIDLPDDVAIVFGTGSDVSIDWDSSAGELLINEDVVISPATDDTVTLGHTSPGIRFKAIYGHIVQSGDLQLKAADGSSFWTLREDDGFVRVINEITGKHYQMVLSDEISAE